jgi:hypothetical protein
MQTIQTKTAKTKDGGYIRVKTITYKLVERVKPLKSKKQGQPVQPVQMSLFPETMNDQVINLKPFQS